MMIYYFSTALSDNIYYDVVKKSPSSSPTFSGVGFDRNVGVGLSHFSHIKGFSLYPITSWPRYETLVENATFFETEGFECQVPSMVTLPFFKELWYNFKVRKLVSKQVKSERDSVIVISGLYRSLLRPAAYLKRKYGMPIVAIVPDLPELMIRYKTNYSKLRRLLNIIDARYSRRFRECVDGFVFLSQYMQPVVNISGKPYAIVDGMVDFSPAKESKNDQTLAGCKYLLYAGKIGRNFGVVELVQAFLKSNLKGFKLCLCGNGDYSDELKDICCRNSNVVYMGVLPHEKVKQLEKNAYLLIEPRPTNSEFVKYSFPSKSLEYMSSGTPLLSTNLPCYSEEYRNYQYRIDDETIDGIAKSLMEICSLPEDEVKRMGVRAREFVLHEKTIVKQCEKIFNLIKLIKSGNR